jgi:hypothetical protein
MIFCVEYYVYGRLETCTTCNLSNRLRYQYERDTTWLFTNFDNYGLDVSFAARYTCFKLSFFALLFAGFDTAAFVECVNNENAKSAACRGTEQTGNDVTNRISHPDFRLTVTHWTQHSLSTLMSPMSARHLTFISLLLGTSVLCKLTTWQHPSSLLWFNPALTMSTPYSTRPLQTI